MKYIDIENCKKCTWKTDVGNKYVCMFKWCFRDKLNEGVDSNVKTKVQQT